jgi:chain length determinant protein tyrosine kinase EpsG
MNENIVKTREQTAQEIEGSSISELLIQAGRLSPEELERIVALQGKEDILFGEAAVELGILTEEDVRWALSSQYSYPIPSTDDPSLSTDLILVHDQFTRRAETIRSIRSGLVLSGVGKIVRSLAVLSPGAGEGKTFLAANLAIGFAQLGARTVLVDLNFRAPRLHELFRLKNNTGASSLIIKRALLEDALQKTVIDSLDILTSGPNPPNPLELLSWPDTIELLENLKQRYEVLIIDTPAFIPTADSLIISGMCDATLLVALKGKTKNAHFGQVKRQLETAGIKILGAVVNEID